MTTLRAFIETPAGSRTKFVYDDVSLELLDQVEVIAPYPCAYGFLAEHMGADGECVDCYLISDELLDSGAVLQGRVVGMIEQWEAGEADHKVLLVPEGAGDPDDAVVEDILAFMRTVAASLPDMLVSVGPVRGARPAMQYLTSFGPSGL